MKERSIKTNVLLSTAYQILTMIIPFITAPYISRVLGAEGVGIYSFTNSIQMYFSMFIALGTLNYGAREIARFRDRRETYSKLFWEIELLTVITTIICLCLWAIWIILNCEYRVYYIIFTISLFAAMCDISWFYIGLEQFKCIVIQNSIFKILGIIALFMFIKKTEDVGIYIAIMSLSSFLGNLSMWIYLPQYLEKVCFRDLCIMRHLRETIIYFVPTIATSIYTILDKTLIGVLTNEVRQNGYYEQATKVINMAKAVTFAALNSVFGSRISYLFAQKKYSEIKEKIEFSINYILFVGCGIGFGIISVAKRFVPIFFGDGYNDVIVLLYILSPIIIIIGLSNCLATQYYIPAGLQKKSIKFVCIGAIVNFVLNIIFIPIFKSNGAAIATLIAEGVIASMYLRSCDGYVNFYTIYKALYKKIISGLLMVVLLNNIDFLIDGNGKALLIEVILGIITYTCILYFTKDSFVCTIYNQMIKKIRRLN